MAFRIANLLGRLGKSGRGAIIAEFALVMPIVAGLLLGMIEYSFVLFTYGSLQAAVRDVSRQVAVNSIGAGDAGAAVRNRLPPWARAGATVSVTASTPGNPATNVYTVEAEVPMASATPVPFYTRAQSGGVSTHVEMKQELPFVTPTP